MRELIYDNVRIQFLSEEVLRLEVRYGAYFTDRNTLWIPDRGAFEKAGKRLPESQSNSGTQPSAAVFAGRPSSCFAESERRTEGASDF